MFRLVPSEAERLITTQLVGWAEAHDRCALRYPSNYGRGRWLHSFVEGLQQMRPGSVFVRIPQDPDRIERVILEIAGAVNPEAQAAVASELHADTNGLTKTLTKLEEVINGAHFIVDGWSSLRSTEDLYEAGYALAPRIDAFREWLEARSWVIADSELETPNGFATVLVPFPDPAAPPSELLNGRATGRHDLWQRYAPDVGAYEAALAMLALDEKPQAQIVPPAWKLREHVAQRLPDSARELLYLMGVHGRTLFNNLIAQFDVTETTIELLSGLGICHVAKAGVLLDPAWSSWCHEDLGERRRAVHLQLAVKFAMLASPEDSNVDISSVAVLEAHRHYLAGGDFETARRFARYTAACLVEDAKQRSLAGKHAEAYRLYQGILDLGDKGDVPLSERLRAYVKHYVHYNKSKSNAESLKETERGYVDSVAAWPENALFWSRLIRAKFYRGASAEALATLQRAETAVPDHHEKRTILIARTVRGLLARHGQSADGNPQHLVDALLVWSDYQPDTGFSRGVGERLERALARGWETRELSLPDAEGVVFSYPQRVRITHSGDSWIAEIVDLRVNRRGETARKALSNLIGWVREEARRQLATFTHTLDPQARLQKQILLGALDVIASRLDAAGLTRVWVIGDLVRESDGVVWLKTSGARSLSFVIPEPLSSSIPVADIPYLALVETGPSSVPVGPVLELKPAYGSAEKVWEEWVTRTHDGG